MIANERQLENTRRKLARLEEREKIVAEQLRAAPEHGVIRVTLHSLRCTMNELREEIAWYECHRSGQAESASKCVSRVEPSNRRSNSVQDVERTIWGVHGGSAAQADQLFLQKGVVALGWGTVGDLAAIEPTRDAFRIAFTSAFPAKTIGAIRVHAGVLFRFVHEMAVGDLIAYPSKSDRQIHLGHVTGNYRYASDIDAAYPNQRPVKWCRAIPRTKFSQGALYEIGSAVALFQIRNYAQEYLAALEDEIHAPPIDADETVSEVAEDIEETTRDFIVKTLAQELKGHPLADFVAHLLNTMGYRTRVSKPGPDGGVDVIAHRDELGFEPPIIKVQVKSSEGKIGDPEVSSLYGKVGANEHGLLVTLGTFTSQAVNFARSKTNLRLIDGDELVNLILTHYEQFSSRYKSILPLKRVFVPESHPMSEDE